MKNRVLLALLFALAGCLSRRADENNAAPSKCTSCHGSQDRQGTETRRAAPPVDLAGNSSVSFPGVGAHDLHLSASSTHDAIACDECHVVPAEVAVPGHIDSLPPAAITLGTLARSGGHFGAAYDPAARSCRDVYCHGDAAPVWTSPRASDQACGTCHTLPPGPPHVARQDCSACHSAVVGADNRTIVSPALHVNGQVDLSPDVTCYACHGSAESYAPPPALNGSYDTADRGVGAHQTHLTRELFTTKTLCSECHIVPATVLEPGHIEVPPAKMAFSGRALLQNHQPVWDGSTCSNAYCHDPGNGAWGGTNVAPIWTEFGQVGCGSCHGLPPPSPHPGAPEGGLSVCADCHFNITPFEQFIDLSKHIDGVVDF